MRKARYKCPLEPCFYRRAIWDLARHDRFMDCLQPIYRCTIWDPARPDRRKDCLQPLYRRAIWDPARYK